MNILKNKILIKFITILNCFLILGAIAALIYGIIFVDDISFKITGIVELIVLIFSWAYLLKGYKKDAAKYYKAFMIACAISYIVEYLAYAFQFGTQTDVGASSIDSAINLISFGCVLTLGVGKDLGKKVSYILCAIYLAAAILNLVIAITLGVPENDPNMLSYVLRCVCWIFSSTLVGIMTVAKYADKKTRNAK